MSGYFGIWQLLFSQKKPFFSLSVSEDKTLGEEMGKREFFFCVSERWGSGGCSSVNVCTVWKSLEKKKKKKNNLYHNCLEKVECYKKNCTICTVTRHYLYHNSSWKSLILQKKGHNLCHNSLYGELWHKLCLFFCGGRIACTV